MSKLYFVSISEIHRIRKNITDPFKLCEILADIFRINTLYMITSAGSGHIGSSFSSLDIITWLWTQEMRNPNESEKEYSDTYFSSKGHDVPALYSLLIGLEKLDERLLHKLRRLNGLPGHPDISTPYIATNTGSLGMGISKARGMALANRFDGKTGRFFVLCGDGELQEGQIWESLQPTANRKFSEITIIVDHNKIQSDTWVSKVSDLGNIEEKFKSFGWEVKRCSGHDFPALKEVFAHFKKIDDRPQVLIADTIKGKGVSFMEHTVLGVNDLYQYHSGAPDHKHYTAALEELVGRINKKLSELGQPTLRLEEVGLFEQTFQPTTDQPKTGNIQHLISAYGDELVKIASKRKDVVVLDADLMKDCGLIPFRQEFPERFIECGIAEQDMVSLAGGLALRGKLPIVHSFACFLSSRPNEQIYNNATEKKKIIYVGSLAGILPSGPGHSHQSVRDISALGAVPGLTIIQPCDEKETRLALHWAVEENPESTYIRLVSIPCQLPYRLLEDYQLKKGHGVFLKEGKDIVLITYGPTMLTEAVKAAQILDQRGISLAVINLPWLNKVDFKWLSQELSQYKTVFTLDDHYVKMGQGQLISAALTKTQNCPRIISMGLEGIPACGQNREVLQYHFLDFHSIIKRIEKNL